MTTNNTISVAVWCLSGDLSLSLCVCVCVCVCFRADRIRKIVLSSVAGSTEGLVSSLVGSSNGDRDGVGTSAKLSYPSGLALALTGVWALVCDNSGTHKNCLVHRLP